MRIVAASVLLLAFARPAIAADVSEISKEDFYAASYYRQALEDERIKKLKGRNAQVQQIAKSIHIKPKELEKAVEKMESLQGDPAELAAAAIKEGIASSPQLKGRVLDVLINTEEPKHVVTYIRWRGISSKEVIKDASRIAHVVAAKVPFVSTLSLAAIHPKAAEDSRTAVWSAKIGRDRMENINVDRIDEYADRLYKRLFEVVDEKAF